VSQHTDIPKNEQAINLLISERFRLLRHAIFLIVLFLFIYNAKQIPKEPEVLKYGHLFPIYFGFVAMFYINMYVLVPLFFFKGRYLLYLILLTIMVGIVLLFISYILDTYFKGPGNNSLTGNDEMSIYTGSVVSIAIIFMTTTFKLFGRWIKDREMITELSDLTLRMELNELRNQINPHFLFNMLNNVKALIRIDPEKASTVIMKLSEFLRYQLYENGETKTSLHSELLFLSNLVELEKLRRDNLSIILQTEISPKTLNCTFLPPNIFTTFIENAIKYSVDINGKPESICIDIAIKEASLHFTCRNSKGLDIWSADRKYSGLGLANIKRRLDLLYQDDHVLHISSTEMEYLVDLTIPL
jgi:sensor histidine kinase YesM